MIAAAASFATGLMRPIAARRTSASRVDPLESASGRRRTRASWVTATSAEPVVARSSAMRATSSAQVTASCPNVGSSSTSMRGAVASAVATESRRFWPPDSVNGFAAARRSRPRRSRSSSMRVPADGFERARARPRARRAPSSRGTGAPGPGTPCRCGSAARASASGAVGGREPNGVERRQPAAGSSPARVRASVDLPEPFGPVTASSSPAGDCERRDRSRTATPVATDARAPLAVRATSAARAAGAAGTRRRVTRNPDPRARRARAPAVASTASGSPSAITPVGAEHDDAVDERRARPRRGARRPPGSRRSPPARGPPHPAPRSRPPGRGSRSARRAAGARAASRATPASARRCFCPPESVGGRMIERQVEPDRVERRAHARPDLVARDAEVLAAERDVVADARHDELRLGILQHQPGPAARRARRARRRPAARRAARPRRRRRARRRARAAASTCPSPRRRAAAPARPARSQVEVAHRPGAAPACRQPQPRGADRRRGGESGAVRSSVRPAPLRGPTANRLSAPVAASARASSHEPRPGDDGAGMIDADDVDRWRTARRRPAYQKIQVVDAGGEPGGGAGEDRDRQRPVRGRGTRANTSSAPSPCTSPDSSVSRPHCAPSSIDTAAATSSAKSAAPGLRMMSAAEHARRTASRR